MVLQYFVNALSRYAIFSLIRRSAPDPAPAIHLLHFWRFGKTVRFAYDLQHRKHDGKVETAHLFSLPGDAVFLSFSTISLIGIIVALDFVYNSLMIWTLRNSSEKSKPRIASDSAGFSR